VLADTLKNSKTALDVIAAASDLALLTNREGTIREVRRTSTQLPLENTDAWAGQPWTSLVTSESRQKIDELIAEADAKSDVRWRHINFPSPAGSDVPMLFSATRLGDSGDIIAFGRDLRNMASLQQRLVEAHQAMERDYLRMRHMETRYRLLFELASEAVLIIDTSSQRILEANPAASTILNQPIKKLVGKTLAESVSPAHRGAMEDLLMGVRSSGDADSRTIPNGEQGDEVVVSASLFRQESGTLFLVRLKPAAVADDSASGAKRSIMMDALEHSPDGFVVTDTSGRILTCNHAFAEMTRLSKAEQVIGRNLGDWLGRSDVDLSVLIANIQQRGAVRLFGTMLRATGGTEMEVEISGVAVRTGPAACLGFAIRDVGQRLGGDRPSLQQLPRSSDQLVELVGRVPLQEIVSETADLIEKLCIEAALRLTRDNRASAAEMLGLSRQSLYVKLRRYGIGEVSDRGKK
jgi:transcriptional regulator PpsR